MCVCVRACVRVCVCARVRATKCCGQNETRFNLLDAISEPIANLTVDSLEHIVLCEQEIT